MEELEIILEVEDNGEQNITISEENIELVYPMLEDLEVTPSKEEQNFKSKMYGYNNVKVKQVTSDVDENIKAENIRVGTTILDVEGSFNGVDTSDATAISDDILEGKTAYVDNTMITGTMKEYDGTYTGNASVSTDIKQFSSIEEMNNSTGNNIGDLCVVYNEGYTDLEVGKTYTSMYLPQTIELDETITSTTYILLANGTDTNKTPHIQLTSTSIKFYRPDKYLGIMYRAKVVNTVSYTSIDGKTYTRTDNLGDYLTVAEIYEDYYTSIIVQSNNYDILTQMFKIYNKTYGGSYKYTENNTWTTLNNNILNVIPSVDEQIHIGEYGEVHIEGDEDLISANIKEGATIFGVPGTLAVGDVKITDAYYLFYNGKRHDYMYEILKLCDWDKITDCERMFCYCRDLTEVDVSSFNTSKVTTMYGMFDSCSKLIELDVSNFDTSNVTNMNYMFASVFWYNQSTLDTLDISNFDAGKVNNIGGFLNSCDRLVNLKFMRNLGKGYTSTTANYSNYRLDLSSGTNLTHDSLMSVINNLYDLNETYSTLGKTLARQSLKLGSTNLAKLTSDEIAIATNKGWNVT